MKLISLLFKKRYQMSLYIHLANLIKEGRNIEAQVLLQNVDPSHLANRSGTTILHVASENNNEVMTQFLLDKQLIDVNAQDYEGKTPVMLSLAELENEKVVRILLHFKPNIFICDNYGKCALQMVFETGLYRLKLIHEFVNLVKEKSPNDEVIAQILINLGCPLHHAILFNSPIITSSFLDQGCPINARDFETGQTALHLAVLLRHVENVEVLVSHGADIDALDSQNKIPFFNYVDGSEEELQILKILVDRGSALTACTDNGGHFPVIHVLSRGNYKIVQVLLNANIDWRARDLHNMTPLHYLLFNIKLLDGNSEIYEDLRKLDFDVNDRDVYGNHLLARVTEMGIWQFVQLLLERGVDPNTNNSRNTYSPLYLAFQPAQRKRKRKYQKCIELLLQYGADPQIVVRFGRTIFDNIVNYKLYDQLDSVLGQLTILEDRGVQIIDPIRAKIDVDQRLQIEFEKCRRQLMQMKRCRIDESITLYEALSEDQKTIAFRARIDIFFFRLRQLSNRCSSNAHYQRLVQKHFKKPIKYATARREIIDILCDVMKLSYASNHIILDKITEYVLYEMFQ